MKKQQDTWLISLSFVLCCSVFLSGCSSTGAPQSKTSSQDRPLEEQNEENHSQSMSAEGYGAQRQEEFVSKGAEKQLDQLARSFYPDKKLSPKASPIEKISHSIPTRLWRHYRQWEGTPYRYGGVSKRGVDCSAFVQIAFNRQFRVSIPRTTRDQMRIGQKVSRSRLKVGDMVFFKTGWRTFHNGIYLGNQQFMHASSSKGVMISSIDLKYWVKRFYTARRVLEPKSSSVTETVGFNK